ncbi:dynein light chain roadblock-type 2 protein [Chloropicon roscoffensis]|uniref:Dynein light chain roadblock n=1 Tax=Chloropicon roscoffensis TaxID=1461544 RepID=A0AAX4P9B1_9CHLO|mmetsp:Transcript_1492/g.5148  ORF Transcript_1492/g.5148 Transcript_1492/m.5148 type:complete len:101 (+) Transcript_1492:1923-2225(+)
MSEVEATLQRINSHKGIVGTIIVDKDGKPIRTTADAELTEKYAELMPDLAGMARSLVRDLDPQNDLEFLRIRAKDSEVMISPHEDFTLIAIQNLNAGAAE